MRKFPIVFLICLISWQLSTAESKPQDSPAGAYVTKHYPNLFTELLGISPIEVEKRIAEIFQQLYYGDDQTERVYYPVAPDMAYIEDIEYNDVRTEGMSYGMMIAVQLDKKEEFDRLWKWAKTYMQHTKGRRRGYFAWHCRPDGRKIDKNSASDGEEWFVMALMFAAGRWGNGSGIFNYQAEAQAILDAMLTKKESSNCRHAVTNMFNKQVKQVVFVPVGNADDFTDPSYHLPHFYELWARWADKENEFWRQAAVTSREFLKKAAHPQTGLCPDYANFDGTPRVAPWGGSQDNFQYDAWRVAMNIAVDYLWFASDTWAVQQSNRLLQFFYQQGVQTHGNIFTLDGRQLKADHSPGLVAMNAVAALAASTPIRKDFVAELWNTSTPSGFYRYYDGLLYLLGFLQVSGNFRIYEPQLQP